MLLKPEVSSDLVATWLVYRLHQALTYVRQHLVLMLLTFLSGFKHHNVIRSRGWLVECGAQFVVSYRQEPGGFMTVQRHQRGQGLLSEREKAPDLDHAV